MQLLHFLMASSLSTFCICVASCRTHKAVSIPAVASAGTLAVPDKRGVHGFTRVVRLLLVMTVSGADPVAKKTSQGVSVATSETDIAQGKAVAAVGPTAGACYGQ